jgi:hypothetical protein
MKHRSPRAAYIVMHIVCAEAAAIERKIRLVVDETTHLVFSSLTEWISLIKAEEFSGKVSVTNKA